MTTKINSHGHLAVDVTRVMADRSALECISAQHAKRWGVLPLSLDDDLLYAVLCDPENDNGVAQLENHTGLTVKVLPALNSEAVTTAIQRYYPENVSENAGTPLGLLEELVNTSITDSLQRYSRGPGK